MLQENWCRLTILILPFFCKNITQLISNTTQGFIQDFQFGGGGGDVVCGLTGMGEYFSQVKPEMVLKALWFHFADK